jgi:hypothetical protein
MWIRLLIKMWMIQDQVITKKFLDVIVAISAESLKQEKFFAETMENFSLIFSF